MGRSQGPGVHKRCHHQQHSDAGDRRTFDGKTSPMWATYVAKTLPNSSTIIIPGIGHLVTPQSPCAPTVVQEFLADPTTPSRHELRRWNSDTAF